MKAKFKCHKCNQINEFETTAQQILLENITIFTPKNDKLTSYYVTCSKCNEGNTVKLR